MTSTDELDGATVIVVPKSASSEPCLCFQGDVDGDPHGAIRSAITHAAEDAAMVHLDLTCVKFMGSAGCSCLFVPRSVWRPSTSGS